MNRQVIPSMILSVFIVCFFSVLLYDRGRPPTSGEPPRAEGKTEPAPVAPAEPSGAIPVAPVETAAATPSAPAPEVPPLKTAKPAPASAPAAPEPHVTDVSVTATASATTTVEAAPVHEPPKTTIPAPSAVPLEPRSAFTTVKDAESLDDVALRVYGSADRADSLWRANRDLLPRRNSPLSSGAVLRTPGE
jgi:hypothetical protein